MCMRKSQGRGLELARKHIDACSSELSLILNSTEFLRLSAHRYHSDDAKSATTGSGWEPVGFCPNLNCKLLSPAPPRAIKLLSWEEVRNSNKRTKHLYWGFPLYPCFPLFPQAINYFRKLLHDLDTICSSPLDPSLEGILHFVVEFQKSQPDLVARAHLQVCSSDIKFLLLMFYVISLSIY